MPLDRQYYTRITLHISYLAQAYSEAQRQILALYPNADRGRDARLTVFAKCTNVIVSTNFALNFFVKEMLDDQWWQQNITNYQELDAGLKDKSLDQYQQVVKLDFVYLCVSALDSSFRTLVKTVNPGISDDENFIKKLKLNRRYVRLLDILRLCRNTTHTNGYHNAHDETIPYKAKRYAFVRGEMPQYFEWSELANLMYDVKDLLLEIDKSPVITKYEKIDDPFAVPRVSSQPPEFAP